MKRILLLLIALLSINALQAQWRELHTGVTEDLYDVFCIDENTAFVCGDNGVILKTEDGGETWVEKNRSEGVWLYDILFLGDVGYAHAGWYVLKTTDGGETWQSLNTNSKNQLFEPKSDYDKEVPSIDLFMIDTDTLYLFAGSLGKSEDSGESWFYPGGADAPFAGFTPYTSKIYFQDNVGYVLSSHHSTSDGICITVWKTIDYGNTWDVVYEITEMEYSPWGFAVHFIDKDNMKIFPCYMPMGRNYPITDFYAIVTNDGFETYSIEPVENNGYYGSITGSKFTDSNNGCYIAYQEWYGSDCKGCGRHIDEQNFACITKDGGQTWQFCYDGIDGGKSLYGIDGIDTTFYIAAQGGYVYRTGTPETIYEWINEPESIDENEEVLTISPNPFSDMIRIDGKISGKVTLLDVTGKVLYENFVCDNTHVINTVKYPSGIYTLKVMDVTGKDNIKKIVKK